MTIDPNNDRYKTNEKVNAIIKDFADGKKVIWVDFNDKFLNEDGNIKSELYAADGLHLGPQGYAVWYDAVLPYFKEICGK